MKDKLNITIEEKILQMLEGGFSKEEILEQFQGSSEVMEALQVVNMLEHAGEEIPVPSFNEFKSQFKQSVKDSGFQTKTPTESPYSTRKMIMYLGGGVMVAALSVVALTGNLSTSPQQYYAGSSEQQEGVSDFQQAYIEVDGTEDKQQEEIPQEPTAQIAQSSAGAESLGDVYVSDAQTMALLDASQGENAATTSNAGPSSAQTSASTASVSGADPIEGSVVQAPDVIPFSCVGIDGAVRMVDGVVVISGDIGSQWITEGDVYGFFSFGSQDGSIIYAKGQFEGSVQSGFKIQSSALREHPNATQIILEDVTRENKCEMDIFEFR